MKRRAFITLLGGAAIAWPFAARAQQPKVPVTGVLWGRGEKTGGGFPLPPFRRGLADAGFVVDKNVMIELREADLQVSRLPALAKDLVQRQVDVIFAASYADPIVAARSATITIPIVFYYGGDPVKDGFVSSLARPGGNVTGVTDLTTEVWGKRVHLLHQLVPGATRIGFLSLQQRPLSDNPSYNNVLQAAKVLALELIVVQIGSDTELERAFATFVERRVEALIIDNKQNLGLRTSVISLAERSKIPAMYYSGFSVRVGGLISYHAANSETFRKAAAQYIGPILKGAMPADLPVQQPVKFELAINLKTAKALGIEVPPVLLALADEVIE